MEQAKHRTAQTVRAMQSVQHYDLIDGVKGRTKVEEAKQCNLPAISSSIRVGQDLEDGGLSEAVTAVRGLLSCSSLQAVTCWRTVVGCRLSWSLTQNSSSFERNGVFEIGR